MKLYHRGIFTAVFLLLVCMGGQVQLHAQRQPVIAAPPLIGDSVKVGKTLTVQDTVFFNPVLNASIAQTKLVDNIVNLYINEFTDRVFPDSFQAVVRIQVNYVTATNTNGSRMDTLTITYKKDQSYRSKAVKLYQDYYSVQVEILEVSLSWAPDESIRPLLVMENMMVIDRNFKTNCAAISSVSSSDTSVVTEGELSVSWPAVAFIPAYDLEWTFVDQAALDSGNYNTGSQLDPNLIFKNNSSRVTLNGNSYRIPLLFDGDGKVFFRVRTLQNAPDGEVIAGIWSTDSGTPGLGSYIFTGHQPNLNWQATTTYAEEGKRKSVVQYFDGSLKGRQTVTKDNTTRTTVVAETLYDKQGRPVIQVLPSPTLSSLIAYTPLFNRQGGINTAEYDKSLYDTLINPNEYCAKGADSMGVASGSSGYYSPLNPMLAVTNPDYHKYLPDAKGYPFTETRYTRDNTGRIDRQGGVGPDFQIGSNRETKYYYGNPAQKDLDALFGTEVGDASHYEKNMVRDANGQYSVSYVDMHGRTVATALAGDAPGNLDQLASFNTVAQTDNLLNPVNNVIKDNSIQAASTILVPKNGYYDFHYSITPESFSLSDCKDSTICYDCLYDLTITISDNCSNEQFGGKPKTITLSNFTLFKQDSTTYNLDTTCTAAGGIDTIFSVFLSEGSYDVTKVLSISKAGMQYYRDSIFLPHNTCKTYNQLLLEQLDSIRQHLECTPDSAVTNLVNAYREQMMADLSPLSGQYADSETGQPGWFSIFNKDGSGRYYYQTVDDVFRDEDGNPDLVNGVAPQNLTPDEFISNFKDSWAATLLPLHPEYRLYLEYEKLKSAYNWETDFFNTETYAEAVTRGFLNPTGNSIMPAAKFTVPNKIDSLFITLDILNPSAAAYARQWINDSIFNYLKKSDIPLQYYNLWGAVTGIVKCDAYDVSCFDKWNLTANVFNTDSLCTADLDMAWRLFRSQYLLFRDDWINIYTRLNSGIFSSQIQPPLIAVFPDRNITTASAGQQYGGYNGTMDDNITAQNNLNAYLYENCKAYATKWWQDLAPCGYSIADSAEIISRLIQVAYEGADSRHPYGSSTVKPSSTHTDRSFEEVINEYNAAHYPSINPVTCNAYLIPNPKPYDQPGVIVNLPIITAPDSCTCSRLTELYYKFKTDSLFYQSFSNYMWVAQGTRISQGKLDTLRSLCAGGNGECVYIEKPILLPPALQCSTGDICVDCNQVRALYDSFAVKFPGITPAEVEPDSIQRQVNQLFATYMNHHLGFSKQAYEYLQFLQSCPPAEPCDSSYWTVYNPGTNLEINADLYVNSVNNIPPVTQFFNGGYFFAPSPGQANHYVLVNKRDSINAGSSTVLMQWRIKPAFESDMINPFVRRGNNTTYVGAEWFKDPADTNWWIGATILKGTDGNMISGMGLQSNSHGLQADWVKTTDPGTGSLLYFDDFLSPSNCSGSSYGPFLCGKQAQDSTIILNMDPCADTTIMAIQGATYLFDIYREKIKGEFENQYTRKCLDAGKLESFTVSHQLAEYHHTLYYYDQGGNLVKTVPPEGVHLIRRQTWFDSVENAREQSELLTPTHRLATTYRYNSLNQVISQHSPDGGLSKFWYDRLGRLVVSQNARQILENNYSYTLYDPLGRIKEVGQKKQVTGMTNALARNRQDLDDWLNYTYILGGTLVIAEQVTSTVYDLRDPQTALLPSSGYVVNPGFQKSFTLRNRVSFTRFYDKLGWNGAEPLYSDYDNGSTYSYDIHGNVDTILHDYRTGLMAAHGYNRFKAMTYRYDLISGKVNEVHYQPGMADQLYHRYEYDAENRLTDAYTVDRKALLGIPVMEEHEARYSYYKHGPLARTVIGQQQVQGTDYAYTLQGWLKGVNGTSAPQASSLLIADMGRDGFTGSTVAKDAYSFTLHYYQNSSAGLNDYTPIATGYKPFANADAAGTGFNSLFNGNIGAISQNIPKVGEPLLYTYKYDQLNRLTKMFTYNGLQTETNSWSTNALQDYNEEISYDANGNIRTYKRNGNAAQLGMDNLTYQYPKDADGNILNNRLRYVHDQVADGNYTEDIDKQTPLLLAQVLAEREPELITDNFGYDAIGNLIRDNKDSISLITWTVYGKIKSITKTSGVYIQYSYDVAGNRISKAVTRNEETTTTWYARDAQGNTIAIYTGISSGQLKLSEHHLYGSSRIGVWNRNIDMDIAPDPNNYNFERGNKFFELSNHLGNVLVTVSDKKIGIDYNSDGLLDYYNADVISANDYYPFGQLQPGRQYGTLGRYGFNGKEQDPETKGRGAQYDYGFRIYDPRISRFLSVDPKTASFPFYTPYQYAGNKPISSIDLDGLEDVHYIFTWTKDNTVIGLHSWREGNVTGHDRNGVEIFDRPYKVYAHYPVHYGDDTYFVTATYDSYEAYKQAKGSDFTGSTILLGTLLGFQAADDMMDKVQLMLGIGAAKGAFKRWFKSKTDELAQWGIKQGDNAAEGILKENVEGQLDEVTEAATKRVIGATGDVGENYLKKLGGQSQVYFNTTKGARFVDQLVNGVAHESKVGYTTLTKKIKQQMAKDAELLKTGKVKEVVWSFFESPVTGKAGASKPLQEALEKAGIKTQIIRNTQ